MRANCQASENSMPTRTARLLSVLKPEELRSHILMSWGTVSAARAKSHRCQPRQGFITPEAASLTTPASGDRYACPLFSRAMQCRFCHYCRCKSSCDTPLYVRASSGWSESRYRHHFESFQRALAAKSRCLITCNGAALKRDERSDSGLTTPTYLRWREPCRR